MGADVKGRHRLRTLLDTLVDDNVIEKAPGNRYPPRRRHAAARRRRRRAAKPLPEGWVAGSLRVHPAGYGFVARDDGEDDVYVAARNRGLAMDGDRVAISTWLGYKGTEGRVEKVLARGRAKLTGTLRERAAPATSSPTIRASPPPAATCSLDGTSGGAKDGQAVVAEITRYPTLADGPLAARSSRCSAIPTTRAPRSRRSSSCADIPTSSPTTSRAGAERAPQEVRAEDLRRSRRPARRRVHDHRSRDRARLRRRGVRRAAARRPGYARCGSRSPTSRTTCGGLAARREARVRGCSVYLPDRAIPMLPQAAVGAHLLARSRGGSAARWSCASSSIAHGERRRPRTSARR